MAQNEDDELFGTRINLGLLGDMVDEKHPTAEELADLLRGLREIAKRHGIDMAEVEALAAK